MLALDRQLGVVADLVLFGDHADPNRVYYSPTRPLLAQVDGQSEMALIRHRGEADDEGAGLLSFTTELVATEAQLEAARDHLEENGVPEAVLGVIPWIAGKAVFAAALSEGDGFIEKMMGETTPDLAGSNRAVFSALLNEDGASLVEGLLDIDDAANPLGVRYELEYLGLRPAFNVILRADYSRLYDEFSVGFQTGVAYQGVGVRLGAESATKKLIEAGAIEIEVVHFTDDADMHGRVDETVRWFQDHVIEHFFNSRLEPKQHQDIAEKALQAALAMGAASLSEALQDAQMGAQLAEQLGVPMSSLQGLGGGGGAAAGGGGQSTFALNLQFELKDIRQEELSVVTLDWREARAERRTAAPQGLLMDLGATPEVQLTGEGDEIWDRLRVNVRPLGDLASLGIDRMIVEVAYPDEEVAERANEVRPLTFDATSTDPQTFAAWTNGRGSAYRTRTEVHFTDGGAWPGPPTHTGDWRTKSSRELGVHPLEDVPRVEVNIESGTVDFETTPQVAIDFRVDGQPDGSIMVSADDSQAHYRRRLEPLPPAGDTADDDAESGDSEGVGSAQIGAGAAPAHQRIEYRPTWFMSSGPSVVGDWKRVERSTLLVHKPFRSERTLRLFPALPVDFFEAIVTVSLPGETATEPVVVRFEPGTRSSIPVALPALAEAAPPAKVHVLVIRGDHTVFQTELFDITDPVVMVSDREGQHRRIELRLVAGEQLSAHGVMAVQVQLLNEADEVTDSVAFSQSNRGPALLLAPIGGEGQIRYRVVRYQLDGAPVSTDPIDTSDNSLLIQATIP